MRRARLNENNEVVPVALSDWGSYNRIIKQEHYKGYFVSTVFLPLDHSFGGDVPIHFETFIFPSDTVLA